MIEEFRFDYRWRESGNWDAGRVTCATLWRVIWERDNLQFWKFLPSRLMTLRLQVIVCYHRWCCKKKDSYFIKTEIYICSNLLRWKRFDHPNGSSESVPGLPALRLPLAAERNSVKEPLFFLRVLFFSCVIQEISNGPFTGKFVRFRKRFNYKIFFDAHIQVSLSDFHSLSLRRFLLDLLMMLLHQVVVAKVTIWIGSHWQSWRCIIQYQYPIKCSLLQLRRDLTILQPRKHKRSSIII